MDNEFSRVVDALPGLVWTALPDRYIDSRNRHWCEYTNLNLDKSCGRGWQTAIHPEDLPELLGRWRSILASGEPGEMQARLRRFDGEYHWLLFHAYPLPDASGQVVIWCGMNTDIEDQRQAEESLACGNVSELQTSRVVLRAELGSPRGHVFIFYSGTTWQCDVPWQSCDYLDERSAR
jgi:PAS domain S-box-containing protein